MRYHLLYIPTGTLVESTYGFSCFTVKDSDYDINFAAFYATVCNSWHLIKPEIVLPASRDEFRLVRTGVDIR